MLLGADNVMLIDDKESNPTQPKAIFLFFSIKKNDRCTGEQKSNSVNSELETKMTEKTIRGYFKIFVLNQLHCKALEKLGHEIIFNNFEES